MINARCTDDAVINTYGEGLMALLQAAGMVVCNGRAPGGGANALTFVSHNGGGSMIDLVCVAANFFGGAVVTHWCLSDLKDLQHRWLTFDHTGV